MPKVWYAIAIWLCVAFCASPALLQAETATLTWTANSESDLAGYKVYKGTMSGIYSPPIDVGKVTTTTVQLPALTVDQRYFLAVTAYDLAGNESPKSSEVSKLIAAIVAPSVTLTILGNPQAEPWGVEITTSVPEPFTTEVWLNGGLNHTESFAPRCLTEAASVCTKVTYPPGTYVIEARILVNGLEVARKSITVVVPDAPPAAPTGLILSSVTPAEIVITASAKDCRSISTSTKGSTALQAKRTVTCVK